MSVEKARHAIQTVLGDWTALRAESVLHALTAAGLAIVPVDPTEEMVEAALAAWRERMHQKTQGGQLRIAAHPSEPLIANYRAMLSAAHPGLAALRACGIVGEG